MSEPSQALLERALNCAVEAAESVAPLLLKGPSRVSIKSSASDVVTDIDVEAEKLIRARIHSEFPSHRLVGEELGDSGDDPDWTWFIDPIDGTTNFARGLPWYAISIALVYRGRPVAAVVSSPPSGFLISAIRDQGMNLLRGATGLRAQSALGGSLVLTEWNVARPWPGQGSVMRSLAAHDSTTRVMGSGTLALAYVALAVADAAMIGGYNPIDHAAGWLLCQEAGLRPLDLSTHLLTDEPPSSPFAIGDESFLQALLDAIRT